MQTAPENVHAWLRLRSVPGIGNLIFRRLVRHFGEPEAVFAARREDLLAVEGITPRLVAALRKACREDEDAKREVARAIGLGCHIVTQNDPRYPPLLLQIPDPPPYFFMFGETAAFPNAVALVGSRNATDYGLTTTRRLSSDLARRGIAVVSGLARGIDTAAHEGALQAGGHTVAVLGSGLARIYPRENAGLCERIAARGAVISEFSPDAEPDAHHFPQRNRIFSGMSLGTVVVEATRRSGSLITARMALEQNREVFAVPGSVHSFKSMGTHGLIKEGAKLVTHVGDILEELPPAVGAAPDAKDAGHPAPSAGAALEGDAKRVYEALSPYAVHVDDLTRQLAIDPGRLAAVLLTLELRGLVRQEPGKLFRWRENAAGIPASRKGAGQHGRAAKT